MKYNKEQSPAGENTRNSSIELLKVIGILLIVMSHVVQTLSGTNTDVSFQDYMVNVRLATTNIQYLILSMMHYGGFFGNTIFFVCSAWYLLDDRKMNKRKILQMLMDIWVISIIILVVVYILRSGHISATMIIRQIFPTTFTNNWYMTCYLLFYPIYPFLNLIIYKVEKSTLLKTTLVMLFLYMGINYLQGEHFFTSHLIVWIVLYFVIAYMKLYIVDMSNNFKLNVCILIIGLVGNYGIIVLTNILGLHMSIFSGELLHWNRNCSPFILLIVIGLFNIARNIHFDNKAINYVSRLSLFIYIIHENMLLRTYYRPMMWQYVYANIGYDYILLWAFVITLIIFLFGLLSSIVYKCTVQKVVTRIGDKLYPKLCSGYGYIEKILFHLH